MMMMMMMVSERGNETRDSTDGAMITKPTVVQRNTSSEPLSKKRRLDVGASSSSAQHDGLLRTQPRRFYSFHFAMLKALYDDNSQFASLDEGRIDKHVWEMICKYLEERGPIKEKVDQAEYYKLLHSEAQQLGRSPLLKDPFATGTLWPDSKRHNVLSLPSQRPPMTSSAPSMMYSNSATIMMTQQAQQDAESQQNPLGLVAGLLQRKMLVASSCLEHHSESFHSLKIIVQRRIESLSKLSKRKSRILVEKESTKLSQSYAIKSSQSEAANGPLASLDRDEQTIAHIGAMITLWELLLLDLNSGSDQQQQR